MAKARSSSGVNKCPPPVEKVELGGESAQVRILSPRVILGGERKGPRCASSVNVIFEAE